MAVATKLLSRWWTSFVVIAALMPRPAVAQDAPVPPNPAASAAMEALRAGKILQCAEGLAAASRTEPVLIPSAAKARELAERMKERDVEHRRQSAEALEKAKTLIESDPGKALEQLVLAWGTSSDRAATLRDPSFRRLTEQLQATAKRSAEAGQWPEARRLYYGTSDFHGDDVSLRDALNEATQRIRILAMYAPAELKRLQPPSTAPVSPAAIPSWRESLKDARMKLVAEAMLLPPANYYRDVSLHQLSVAGVTALKRLVETEAVAAAFDHPIDPRQRTEFLTRLDAAVASLQESATPQKTVKDFLQKIESANRETVKLPEEVLAHEFFAGVCSAMDSFTSMIWPADLADWNKAAQGKFSGVGIQLKIDEQSRVQIVSPIEGSPAHKAGVKAGDVVLAIDGKGATGLTLPQTTKLIGGPTGSTVTLTLLRTDGTQKDFPLTRQSIKVASVKGWLRKPGGGWDYLLDPEQKIGFVRVVSFTGATVDELNDAIQDVAAAGGRALIIDVRYNPGGATKAATDICDRFLSDGKILETRGGATSTQRSPPVTAQAQGNDLKFPLVILTNEYSANCSEILAGVLQDHKRAVIVGARSFGKADLQLQYPIAQNAAYFKLTTAHYVLPGGRDFQREPGAAKWGIEPDVEVVLTPAEMTKFIQIRQDMDTVRDEPPTVSAGDLRIDDPQLSAALLAARLQLAGGQ